LDLLDLRDRPYCAEIVRIGLPIVVQNLILNGLLLVSTAWKGCPPQPPRRSWR
jgi:hypothetical protein